jgi:hypothetical protein
LRRPLGIAIMGDAELEAIAQPWGQAGRTGDRQLSEKSLTMRLPPGTRHAEPVNKPLLPSPGRPWQYKLQLLRKRKRLPAFYSE